MAFPSGLLPPDLSAQRKGEKNIRQIGVGRLLTKHLTRTSQNCCGPSGTTKVGETATALGGPWDDSVSPGVRDRTLEPQRVSGENESNPHGMWTLADDDVPASARWLRHMSQSQVSSWGNRRWGAGELSAV